MPVFMCCNRKFFDLLEQLAESSYEAANQLSTLMRCPNPHDEVSTCAAITSARSKAKAKTLEITNELCRSFFTPFDREDIQGIADLLYRIAKISEKVMERIRMHKLGGEQDDFYPQSDLIKQEAEVMRELIRELATKNNSERILSCVTRLNQLEQDGDIIRRDLMVALYESDRPTRDLLIRRDIYDMLEKVVDRFRDVAAIALHVVLKKSYKRIWQI